MNLKALSAAIDNQQKRIVCMNLKLSKPVQELEIVLSSNGGVIVMGYEEIGDSEPFFEKHFKGREMIADFIGEGEDCKEDVEESIQDLREIFLASADYLAAIKRMRDVETKE